MKKLLVMFCVIMMSVTAFADKSASCAFQSRQDAYVVAEVHVRQLGNCQYTGAVYDINVNSYGVNEGAVIVQIQYETKDHGTNTLEKTIYISNGKGDGSISGECAKSWTDFSVSVYNAVCR
jgi:hypothetical protein